jgi:hypothetical protein
MAAPDFTNAQELQKAAADFARMAVVHAEKFYATKLDFTEKSVEDVQLILERLSEAVPRGLLSRLTRRPPSDADMLKVATAYGAYVGELLRMHHGGEWKMLELPEGSTMAVQWDADEKQAALTLAVAHSILRGEKKHNILLYYRAFAAKHPGE